MKLIAPSILSADFSNLATECSQIISMGADWLHVDVMDGHFVPNLTIGPCVVESLRKAVPKAYLDCHLMVTNPEQWLEPFYKAGADMFTFHFEALESNSEKCVQLCQKVKALGMKAGVSIKPKTQVSELSLELLKAVDMLLIMTVEPGFGGQKYMPECSEKCLALKKLRADLLVEVDGGISDKTIAHASGCGIDVFVAGSYVFNAEDRAERIRKLKE
ncbi:Ribulose-phosphate_3-epimerase [Hexamita inflata]|uniref:Ribulose-phosphate 3-epimerase n=1 Tax=Hexamita inflata TaxID=28002 RepID=A0AA86R0X9_9EUKA|nr:Ribulose-phosphate 3-epimerase [Hexamita inflata]